MNRTELTVLVAGTFLVAIALGWTLRWLFTRINRTALNGSEGSNDLAARLYAAEEAQASAIAESDARVREMQNKLVQTEAELEAAMDGLGDARRDADALRNELMDLKG